MSSNKSRTLFILYQPIDFPWVTKVGHDLRNKYDYQYEIVLVPMATDISEKEFVVAQHVVLKTTEVFQSLMNFSEIVHLKLNKKTHLPKYPEHSVLLVEYDNTQEALIKSVWASNKYYEDIATFTSKDLRRKELLEALDKLNNITN